MADAIEQNGVFDGYQFRESLPYNAEPIDPDSFNANLDDEWEEYVTLEDAANAVPNDPIGASWEAPQQSQQFKVSLPKRVQADIEGKLAFMISTTAMAVSMPDPVCGQALLQNTPDIAKALTPIICQSPGVVAWFQKTSNIMLYVNLAMAMVPFIATVLDHHLPSKNKNQFNGPASNGQMNIKVDPNAYAVQ
jgi:hypothetical protein